MASQARVLARPVSTIGDLDAALRGRDVPEPYSVAVEALVFDDEGRWVLMERGPECRDEVGKLEGIGGGVEDGDDDLRAALRREIREKVGTDADITVGGFFEARTDTVEPTTEGVDERHWIVVSYLCRLEGGELKRREPGKNEGFHRLDLDEVEPERLSSSARSAFESLRSEPERVERLLGRPP